MEIQKYPANLAVLLLETAVSALFSIFPIIMNKTLSVSFLRETVFEL